MCRNGAAYCRSSGRTYDTQSVWRKDDKVGSQAENMEGISSTNIFNAARMGSILRLTQRRAPGRNISTRILSTAFSCEGAFSTSSMTSSTCFNSPGNRADKQSGRKLNVACPILQYHLAIFVPSGYFLL